MNEPTVSWSGNCEPRRISDGRRITEPRMTSAEAALERAQDSWADAAVPFNNWRTLQIVRGVRVGIFEARCIVRMKTRKDDAKLLALVRSM